MKNTSSDKATELYNQVIDQLSHEAPIVSGQMFGMPNVKLNGKAVFGLFGDAMVFKLPETKVAKALEVPGAALFDPMGGRPMKQWVQIPIAQSDEWFVHAQAAVQGMDPTV